MNSRSLKGLIAVAALALAPWLGRVPAAFAAGSTSPGKNAVFVTVDSGDWSSVGLVEGTIAKGKRRNVLEVELTFEVAPFGTSGACGGLFEVFAPTTVNDVPLEPDPSPYGFDVSDCELESDIWFCRHHRHAWLDLDAAEAAHPGVFIGQPLNIRIVAWDGGFVCQRTGHLTFSAKLVKK